MLERFNDWVFDACVELLHQLPSVALQGASVEDMVKLVKRHHAQARAIADLRNE